MDKIVMIGAFAVVGIVAVALAIYESGKQEGMMMERKKRKPIEKRCPNCNRTGLVKFRPCGHEYFCRRCAAFFLQNSGSKCYICDKDCTI